MAAAAAAATFRERARPLLNSVELAYASEPEVAQLLADVRRELDGGRQLTPLLLTPTDQRRKPRYRQRTR